MRKPSRISNDEWKAINQLGKKLKAELAGKSPAVQGVALAEMVGIWVAGHVPEAHTQLMLEHVKAVQEFAAMYRTAALGKAGLS
jgi:hypothetical protein